VKSFADPRSSDCGVVARGGDCARVSCSGDGSRVLRGASAGATCAGTGVTRVSNTTLAGELARLCAIGAGVRVWGVWG
jgi:hypothetical protein